MSRRIILTRGERVTTITVRPWLMGGVAVFAALFGVLYLGATCYLLFRDDLFTASIARQARIRHAYEDRIASLRADIDRLTSRQLIGQQALEEKLARLIDRQAALDTRQDIIAGLSQAARRAGMAPAAALLRTTQTGAPEPSPGAADRIGAVESSLDDLAAEQVAYVARIAQKTDQRTRKIGAVLSRLGYNAATQQDSTESGLGGPFIPLPADADPETFRSSVDLVTTEIEKLAAVRRTAAALPLTRPIANAAVTSRFGARMDPFLGRPAMHNGIDFRATDGYPIRATAAGTVVTAEYTGGYGNMVEIDHGNGLTTRYAHLSRIVVKAGDVIAKGAIVGRAGSTGRSTGPHVHYEVRVDGGPIDPMRYIRAGSEIAPLL